MKKPVQLKFLRAAIVLLAILLSSSSVSAQTSSETAATTVGATLISPTDFSIRIVPDRVGEVNPGKVVTYTIYYQNSGNQPAQDLTLGVNWSFKDDTVAEYVLNSAETAYSGSLPSVDLINQTISWSISTLPSDAGLQQTSFQLLTGETHPYPGTYFFYVDGQLALLGSRVATAERVVNSVTYQEGLPPVGPPVAPAGVIIGDVRILEITAHHARIAWKTSQPANSLIRYGLSKAYGLEVASPNNLATDHFASLDDLDSETTYHFQIVARSKETEAASEDYLFKTAQEGVKVPTVDVGSLLFRAYRLRLHSNSEGLLRMFPGVDFEIELPIYGEGLAVNLDLHGRSLSLFPQETPWFSGSFTAPDGLGEYLITAEVVDRAGNYVRTDLAVLVIVSRPRVTDPAKRPVARAIITLYRFNPFINRFAPFDLTQFDQQNPSVTPAGGSFGWVVPYGRYELRVDALGYQHFHGSEIVVLQNSILAEEVVLQRLPLGLLNQIRYWLQRLAVTILGFLGDLWQSLRDARLVEQLALPLLILTVAAILIEFLNRTGLNWRTILPFFLYQPLFKKTKPWGEIRDTANGLPVYLVFVGLFNSEGKRLDWTFTDRKGEFGFDRPPRVYYLQLVKKGFFVPEWELTPEAPQPRLRRMIQINLELAEAWAQVWVSRGLKVRGKPILSQGMKVVEGLLLNLANFTIVLGLLAAVINLVNHHTPQAWVILALYLVMAALWTLLLWFR